MTFCCFRFLLEENENNEDKTSVTTHPPTTISPTTQIPTQNTNQKRPKVAIAYTGRLNYHKQTYPQFLEYVFQFNRYYADIDLFMCVSDEMQTPIPKKLNQTVTEKFLKNHFQIKWKNYETELNFPFDEIHWLSDCLEMINEHEKKFKFQYDLIFRVTSEAFFTENVSFQKMIEDVDCGKMCVFGRIDESQILPQTSSREQLMNDILSGTIRIDHSKTIFTSDWCFAMDSRTSSLLSLIGKFSKFESSNSTIDAAISTVLLAFDIKAQSHFSLTEKYSIKNFHSWRPTTTCLNLLMNNCLQSDCEFKHADGEKFCGDLFPSKESE